MVFAWRADKPQAGVHPLHVNAVPSKSAPPREGFVYKNGHNVVSDFATWIRTHGGWSCAGEPLSEPFTRGDQTCQIFANIWLCYDPQAHSVTPQPIGHQFWQANRDKLKTDLPALTTPGWQAQVAVTLPSMQQLQVRARVVSNSGTPCEALAVQIDDFYGGRTFHIGYKLISGQTLAHGVWEGTIPLSKLAPGKHTLVAKVCAVGPQGWLACAADSTTLKIANPSK